jgi:hypothetical protein
MNMKIGTKAAQFPEKEYINGIFLAVCSPCVHISLTSEKTEKRNGRKSIEIDRRWFNVLMQSNDQFP